MMALLNVTQLNMLIQREISFNPYLKQLEVEAEIAKLTRHASGHLYFTIKDAFSSIDCVMFKSQAQRVKQRFQEGDRVIIKGQISVYEKTARLQFYAQSIEPIGDGVFLKAFHELKEKLEREGLLDPDKKLPIPRYPKKLALLTSATGAAKADFLKVFHRKNPLCDIVLIPIAVQGEQVVPSTFAALEQLPEETDLIVITRGGGSYEDLRFFNDEALARRVFALPIPTIAAIGHEVDFTIIEFVASARAATPTAAAEIATDDVRVQFQTAERTLRSFSGRFESRLQLLSERLRDRYLNNFQFRIEKRTTELERTAYETKLAYERAISDRLSLQSRLLERFLSATQAKTTSFQTDLSKRKQVLDEIVQHTRQEALKRLDHFGLFLRHTNPIQVLDRGFSYLEQAGQKIRSINDISLDKPLINHVTDGQIISTITEVKHEL